MNDLLKWKGSKRRKPLILKGARQVGKTWILKEFGKSFPDGSLYFNFDKEEGLRSIFEKTKDTNIIIDELALVSGRKITEDTLIIFDEIQACSAALNSLKYFCEDNPEYYIACAGSLLGIDLAEGFPVGKVNCIEMHPMTYEEFLLACDDRRLLSALDEFGINRPVPDVMYISYIERMKQYFTVGGMPEAVKSWSENRDPEEVDEILEEIIFAYERDMGKHPDKNDIPKVHYIWDSVASQLARENKKFLYNAAREGARAREYENALNWLVNADILHKVNAITKPGLPVSAYDDLSAFKIFMNDVGILRKKSGLSGAAFSEQSALFEEFRGAFTENYVLQSLITQLKVKPRYWKDTKHEVDFIVQHNDVVVPVEVKAGSSVKTVSMKRYAAQYDCPLMLRISLKNITQDGNVLNIPLFLTDRACTLMSDD